MNCGRPEAGRSQPPSARRQMCRARLKSAVDEPAVCDSGAGCCRCRDSAAGAGALVSCDSVEHGRGYVPPCALDQRTESTEEKCDLSPDGRLFVYLVLQGSRWGTQFTNAWTAVSRVPWLTAPAVWPQGTTYGGGGRFLDNLRLVVRCGEEPFVPDSDAPLRGLDWTTRCARRPARVGWPDRRCRLFGRRSNGAGDFHPRRPTVSAGFAR